MIISDDGIGVHENLEIEDIESLRVPAGNFPYGQLAGELELKRNNGTESL